MQIAVSQKNVVEQISALMRGFLKARSFPLYIYIYRDLGIVFRQRPGVIVTKTDQRMAGNLYNCLKKFYGL